PGGARARALPGLRDREAGERLHPPRECAGRRNRRLVVPAVARPPAALRGSNRGRRAVSGPTRPPWSGFDPGSAPGLEGAADGPGRVVALLASPSAVSDGWGTEIAIGLARAWSASGRDVV